MEFQAENGSSENNRGFLLPPPMFSKKKLRLVFPPKVMKPRDRGVFRESGELLHFGKGQSVYFALAGQAVTVVQTEEKLADRGHPGADSQVSASGEVRSSSLVQRILKTGETSV